MENIKPFIDMGWHTIQLSGELKRLPNGKKTRPIFSNDWLENGTAHRNELASKLGGAITGKVSNIVAIDCDNTITYELFKALDPDYGFHFVSRGKKDADGNDLECGTIVYEYDEEFAESFKSTKSGLAIDFLSDNRMTFLPTDDNDTKEPFNHIPPIKPMPPQVAALVRTIKSATVAPAPQMTSDKLGYRLHLAPKVKLFLNTGEVTPQLFRILTPKSFREHPEYQQKGYLHPNDVKDGEGSEYMMKVSAILGADVSIDTELYLKVMEAINQLWDQPMAIEKLQREIMDPMAGGKSTNDQGEVIWQEDPNWEMSTMPILTKTNSLCYVFYDPRRLAYYVINTEEGEEEVLEFDSHTKAYNHIKSTAIEFMKAGEFQNNVPNILSMSKPRENFGFFTNDRAKDCFNTFVSTNAYKVFKDPAQYKAHYNKPVITLRFLEHLIPDEQMRSYLLGFMRRKFDTFDYSPVILYFLGVPGSGKDTFVGILRSMIGEPSFSRPEAQVFLDKFNSWVQDSIFVQLDEYGDTLSTFKEKASVLGKLKAVTGSATASIRAMQKNTYTVKHNVTFIMTANSNPLMLEDDDRRIVLFNCPNKLVDADWLADAGGIGVVIDKLETELEDFAYYLATEVHNLSTHDYTTPPKSMAKQELIVDSMPKPDQIAYLLKNGPLEKFVEMADTYGSSSIFEDAERDRIAAPELFDLYSAMRDDISPAEAKRRMTDALKKQNVERKRSTKNGNNHMYFYYVPGLLNAVSTTFTEIEEEDDSADNLPKL